MRWRFTISAGAGAGLSHEYGPGDMVIIGACDQAHLRLDDPYVSGLHVVVETHDRTCLVRDLGSTNGTWINGERVDACELAPGDRLRVGRTTIDVSAEPVAPADEDARCVRCGGVWPRSDAVSSPPGFLCPHCEAREASSRRDASRSSASERCSRCGVDVSDAANRDGRAVELRDVASYCCETCATLQLERRRRVLGSLGEYEVLRSIGAGGFGEVWLARHRSTGRLAAVKAVLKRALSRDAREAGWFAREMGVVRDLVHPHVVRWYDSGQDDLLVYFAAEYVSGGDLERAVGSEGAPSARHAVELAIQTLSALEFAHGRGIIHRDVKPSNILLAPGPDGERVVKISDFGLAKSFRSAGSSLLTRMGEVRGTPLYMAPEQFLNFRFVGPSADVYAVGVVLYQLLSGAAPFDTERAEGRGSASAPVLEANRELVRIILEEERVPLRERRPEVHVALAAVVDIAVQRDASDRFETAAGLAAELERVLHVL